MFRHDACRQERERRERRERERREREREREREEREREREIFVSQQKTLNDTTFIHTPTNEVICLEKYSAQIEFPHEVAYPHVR